MELNIGKGMSQRDQALYNAAACLMGALEPIGDNQDSLGHEETINVFVKMIVAYGKTCAQCLLRSASAYDRLAGSVSMKIINDAKEEALN